MSNTTATTAASSTKGDAPTLTTTETRRAPRLNLPAMYTLVRVRPAGEPRYRWTGYIYDISTTGMRFELDEALPPGMKVELRAMLPGAHHTMVMASGHVVRRHDDEDEPGPCRMGLSIDKFQRHVDRRRLADYLEHAGVGPRLAA